MHKKIIKKSNSYDNFCTLPIGWVQGQDIKFMLIVEHVTDPWANT